MISTISIDMVVPNVVRSGRHAGDAPFFDKVSMRVLVPVLAANSPTPAPLILADGGSPERSRSGEPCPNKTNSTATNPALRAGGAVLSGAHPARRIRF
jgi:hypothetical protein